MFIQFKISGVRRLFYYCNQDGLYYLNVVKGIDDKEKSYDDTLERRELERMAEIVFG